MKIEPYTISFSNEFVKDLKVRLSASRYPNKNLDTNNVVQKILDYWEHDYNFQEREKYINQYPHFKTSIQGLDIHFVHVKPKVENLRILPLLMLHGWPNSIMEFYKIIPLLELPRIACDFVFEVVVPSLPGFGFSNAPTDPGLSCIDMSVILKNLMLRLGHDKFYIVGGDWNSFISCTMSSLFPDNVLGTYSSVCAIKSKKKYIPSSSALANIPVKMMLSKKFLHDTKYFQILPMKPKTTEVGLNDSPAALALYIMEKFLIGTDNSAIDDDFLDKYGYDELIDNFMIYWASNTITAAVKMYAEQFCALDSRYLEGILNADDIKVPNVFRYFVSKIPINVRIQRKYANIYYIERCGRFPAIEEPIHFTKDIFFNVRDIIDMKTYARA